MPHQKGENTMANVLFVKAHPGSSSQSVSLGMAEKFLETYKTSNPSDTVTTLDLYSDEIPLIDSDVLSAWGKFQGGQADQVTAEEGRKVARLGVLSDQFVAADKVIFAAPMWNFGYPPMMKAYMDGAMVVSGKTFAYTEQGPKGLLNDKTRKAIILEASGSHFTGTPMEAYTHASNHLKGILNFIGVQDVTVVKAEGVSQFPDKRDEIISSAHAVTVSTAASF
jgi:FMN-dependent NADH-azoreductase